MSYMTPDMAPYLDAFRQIAGNPMGGPAGGGVGGTMVGSSPVNLINPVGAGPVTGTIPGLPTNGAGALGTTADLTPEALAGGAAGGAGGGGGWLAGLAGLGGGGAPLAAMGARLAALPGGALTTYGLPVAAGLLTDKLANNAVRAAGLNQNSMLSDVGEGAAGGAVTGGAIGALGLPIPLVGEVTTLGGAGIGALIGGGAGLLGHLFGGGGGKQAQQTNWGREASSILDQAKQAGVDPQMASDLYNQYGIYLRSKLANTRGTDQEQASRQDAYQQLAGNLQTALTYQQRKNATQSSGGTVPGYNMGPSDYAALQALSAAYIKPYTDMSLASSAHQYDILSHLADKIGGTSGNEIRAQATAANSAAERTAAAYGAQAQLAPTFYGFQQQRQQMEALASQLQSQAIASYLANGGLGGSSYPAFNWSSGAGGLSGIPGLSPTPATTKKK